MFDEKDFEYWVNKCNGNPNTGGRRYDSVKQEISHEDQYWESKTRPEKRRGFALQPLRKMGWKFVDPNFKKTDLSFEDDDDDFVDEDIYAD